MGWREWLAALTDAQRRIGLELVSDPQMFRELHSKFGMEFPMSGDDLARARAGFLL